MTNEDNFVSSMDNHPAPRGGEMNDTKFRLYTCNNLMALGREYYARRTTNPSLFKKDGFFEGESVCVATQGMAIWLQHFLVEQGHVVANMQFPFIRNQIDEILATYMKGNPSYRPELFKEDVLIWRLYRLLQPEKLKANESLQRLSVYLEADKATGGDMDVRRFELSKKLAQLYYDYMAFVPEKLHPECVGNNKKAMVSPEQQWQVALWKQLCTADDGTELVSPAEAMLEFIRKDSTLVRNDYGPLTFFGISAMAPYFLLVLKKLSTVQPVNFFYLNHCDELWDDVKTNWEKNKEDKQAIDGIEDGLDKRFENTLLGNFGTQGREFFKAVLDLEDDVEYLEVQDVPMEWGGEKADRQSSSGEMPLLKDIQSRILHNQDEAVNGKALPRSVDDSLTVHSCFNDIREVEALHDCLLKLIQHYKGVGKYLSMNDIIVMAPDISRFTNAIHAVFDRGPLRNSYSISDRSVMQANLMAESFLNIMSLHKSRFEVSRISRLLDSPPLRARFGFDDDSVAMLRHWFLQAGICWGMDKSDRRDLGDFEEFSWQFGLDRLLLKLAVDAPSEEGAGPLPFGCLAPADIGTGKENVQLLNGLFRFIGELQDFVKKVQEAKAQGGLTGDEWCELLMETRAAFFQADSDSAMEYSQIGRTLTCLREALNAAGFSSDDTRQDNRIPYEVILTALSAALDTPMVGEPFLNGKITFCSLLPMRGIPCKIIAMLGMDAGEFPRPNDATGYNLVKKDKDGGSLLKYYDRSRNIEDRFTFLEALMSAQEYLMIFYKGQNDQTLDELLPAAPVVELLDYVKAIRKTEAEDKEAKAADEQTKSEKKKAPWPMRMHRLNAFDACSFGEAHGEGSGGCIYDGNLLRAFSFDENMARVANSLQTQGVQSVKALWIEASKLDMPNQLPHRWHEGDNITIDLEDLVRFLKNPPEAYMTQRLGFPKSKWEEKPLSDYELFELNDLEKYGLRKEVGEWQMMNAVSGTMPSCDNQNVKDLCQLLQHECKLPVGAMGEQAFNNLRAETWISDGDFRKTWAEQKKDVEPFKLELGEIEVKMPEAVLNYLFPKQESILEATPTPVGEATPEGDGQQSTEDESGAKSEPPVLATFKVTLTGSFKYYHGEERKGQNGQSADAKMTDYIGIRDCFAGSTQYGRHTISFFLQHLMLCATKDEEIFSCQMPFKKKDLKAVELWSKKTFEAVTQDNTGTETNVRDRAKEQLRKIVELFLYGHFYPLPLFGKLSPQLAGKGTASDKDELKFGYGQMLFVDLQDACDSKEKEKEKELLRSLAEVCYGPIKEDSKNKGDKPKKEKGNGTKRSKKDAAGE